MKIISIRSKHKIGRNKNKHLIYIHTSWQILVQNFPETIRMLLKIRLGLLVPVIPNKNFRIHTFHIRLTTIVKFPRCLNKKFYVAFFKSPIVFYYFIKFLNRTLV
ncbi:hypothetical protein PanWU01x14_277920 [Parasponia andersonii]|uniref:Uncharacterized protein n=1 Tax=Parasponia andersonii TaxID=3476 RepID=A0A2P5B2A5_PARAD|nr:hypothetical protein PanWU01x14_277920 [Parasponia andersonii]